MARMMSLNAISLREATTLEDFINYNRSRLRCRIHMLRSSHGGTQQSWKKLGCQLAASDLSAVDPRSLVLVPLRSQLTEHTFPQADEFGGRPETMQRSRDTRLGAETSDVSGVGVRCDAMPLYISWSKQRDVNGLAMILI